MTLVWNKIISKFSYVVVKVIVNEIRSFVWSASVAKSPTMTTEPEGLVNNAACVIERTAVAVSVAVHCS